MVGLFGVLAYSMAQRVREFGVRRALGATTADVLRLVLGGTARVLVSGVLVGLAVALPVGRVVATMLFGVTPLDAVTFAVVLVALAVSGAVATIAPAWRAVRVDPAAALRS